MKAIVLGSTGLVGRQVLKQLEQHPQFSDVLTITRRPEAALGKIQNICLTEPLMDGEKNISLNHRIQLIEKLKSFDKDQTIIYCALGTTLKTAGSRSKFYEIDHDLVMAFANLFKKLEYPHFWFISAMGADVDSSVFYNHVKGETESDIQDLKFPIAGIIRPSLLLGDRKEFRTGEKIATWLSPLLSPLMQGSLKKFKPVYDSQVAAFMISKSLSLRKSDKATFQVFENNLFHDFEK